MSERDADDSLHGKVSGEHRRLGEMFEDLRSALRPDSSGRPAAAVFEEMREEVATHFGVEEQLYYPSIWALRPERKGPLASLLERHPRLLTQLDEIAAALEAEDRGAAGRLFESFATDFGLHEAAEESILLELEQSLE
jgi:hypothetical protein